MKQRGVTVWFTGLYGAGKTTVSSRVHQLLKAEGVAVEILDGDVLRQCLCKELGFSKEDRVKNVERAVFVAKLLTRNNIVTLASLISPYHSMREHARQEIGEFLEVYVNAPMAVLIERDVKGLYQKAIAGEVKDFTGLDAPYEEPQNPDLMLCTDTITIDQAAEGVILLLKERGYLAQGV